MSNVSGWVSMALWLCCCGGAGGQPAQPHAGEREGSATLIHRADVLREQRTNSGSEKHLWPVYSTADVRMNYFEVTSRTGLHFHPDGEHRLYVLEGNVVVTCGTNTSTAGVGDLVIIPRGVRHCYDVPRKGDRALLLTFDAPPYDPRKTVNLESSIDRKLDAFNESKAPSEKQKDPEQNKGKEKP